MVLLTKNIYQHLFFVSQSSCSNYDRPYSGSMVLELYLLSLSKPVPQVLPQVSLVYFSWRPFSCGIRRHWVIGAPSFEWRSELQGSNVQHFTGHLNIKVETITLFW